MKILAIETSCDETAAAVAEDGTKVISSALASSTLMHRKYGGIVPEVAAREQLQCILPVIQEALIPFAKGETKSDYKKIIETHIDAIAVAAGPGLIGPLLVGVETAKTFAAVCNKPLIPVNHVLAHMFANFIGEQSIEFPAISLVVSGGHTELFLMESGKKLTWLGGTLDDAAGEAFDKTARLLGFENRGGPAIQESAKAYDGRDVAKFPRPILYDETFNFSFSGLKTAILREWQKLDDPDEKTIAAFAHETQEAITDVLVEKTLRATKKYNAKSILLSGGVAANLRLREKFHQTIELLPTPLPLYVPPIELCTDNAVYIASYAFFRGTPVPWQSVGATPDLSVEDID